MSREALGEMEIVVVFVERLCGDVLRGLPCVLLHYRGSCRRRPFRGFLVERSNVLHSIGVGAQGKPGLVSPLRVLGRVCGSRS